MPLNPVERRLLQLREHWEVFRADGAKRLLVWRLPNNAIRMAQCFCEMQKYETEYSSKDLFIVFDAPFEHSIQYSRALKESLAGQYAASHDDLKRQGLTPGWRLDPDLPDSPAGFVRALRTLGSEHHTSIGQLVAVLMPGSVADDEAYASWLMRCLGSGLPERLRLFTIDPQDAPRLGAVDESVNPLVLVQAPQIDALATAQETFAQEAAVGPAAVFRNYLIGLVSLVEKGSADQVKAKAIDSFAFAHKHGWLDQEVVVRMLLAGALLKERRCNEAVKVYAGARESAAAAATAGHPAGQQLVLQTWFGEAGARLAAAEVEQAALCYEAAATLAREIPHPILAIEASRMVMFCHARQNQLDAAIEHGTSALDYGQLLKPEVRAMTSLPLVAVDLLRVIEPERVTSMEAVKHRLVTRTAASREHLERCALAVEQGQRDVQPDVLEADLQRETADAEEVAARDLEQLGTGGGAQFTVAFSLVRTALHATWPHALLDALPAAAIEPAAAGGEGAAAS